MDLREFMSLATPAERDTLAEAVGTTVGYLQSVASRVRANTEFGGGYCSILRAYEIELETEKLAAKNPTLAPVNGETLVRNKRRYRDFVRRMKRAA